ncbi:MAG: FG-GAP-like repeat-containing protein [Bacteroidota bacterium]
MGYPGSTVTITGTNFNTTPANNIVYFGATRATVTAAGSTSLTATVPIGTTYQQVSVNNTASVLTGYSQYPFLPTYDNSAYIPGIVSFATKADFAAGTNARSVAIGDIDGDGKPDMAVANYSSSTISVYHNTSSSGSITTGSFATQVTFTTGSTPISVAIGDIDGDGKPDLAVTNGGSATVSVFRNTSSSGSITSGSFATQVTFATGTQPFNVAIGDIDGDGKPDMAVANASSSTVSVYRNNSSSGSITGGSFATQVTFATGSGPSSVAIGDLDGDGKPDLTVANTGSNTVSVLRNTSSSGSISSGSFDTQVTFETGSQPQSVAIGDIDGDGKSDLITANYISHTISVFRNTSSSGSITTSSFATQVTFATGWQPISVAIGDINGDGKPDLAVANSAISGTVSVLRNTSSSGSITTGTFATQVTFATGSNPQSIAVGDIDGDGKPDLATANVGGNSISVLRNNPLLAPPAVTSISPQAGNTGTSVTVTGTNFNTTPANNIVFFGATQATVTAAGTTSLTATVPVGATYKNVSVNNTALSLAGYSRYPFLPTYDNSAYIPGTVDFAAKADFAAGTQPYSVAIGDIDGDGKPDMAVANNGANTVSVYRNTSSSGSITSASFAAQVTFATGSGPRSVAIGDIDGDGKPDLAVANQGSSTVSVYRNTSSSGSITSGSFAAQITFTTGANPYSVAIGDIDGDGKPDLAVANGNSSGTVSVLRNTGSSGSISTGSFATRVAFVTGSQPSSVAIGDIDGDGKPDLAVANYGSNTVSVFRNSSSIGNITSGSFATQVTFATGTQPNSVAIADIDGDGKTDMVVANLNSATVSVLRNTSSSGSITSGSFATQVTYATGSNPYNVAIGDIDGDGKPDLAVANAGSNTVSVLRNTSSSGSITSGSFAAQVTFATGTQPLSVAVGDIDGDGKPDLATANYASSGTVSVLRNTPLILPPAITSISPQAGNTGTSVTVTGTNFNTTPSNNIVFFGATQATVTAAGTTSLTATVPVGATYQRVSVNNTALSLAGYSQYPFLPTYDNSAYIPGTVNFAGKVDFTADTYAFSVAIGDIDGDGKPDLAVANPGSNTVFVYRNTSSSGSINSGSFATQVTFTTGTTPYSVAIGDIDGDGKPDLAVANYSSNTVSVYRNTSSSGSITMGSFATAVTFTTGSNPICVAIGDIDGDGKPDLAVANQSSNTVSVLRNTGSSGSITSGSFATQVTFAIGAQPRSVAIGDIDGDGKPDLAVANQSSNTVSVLRNTSSSGSITTGSFAPHVTFGTGISPSSVVIGDIDGDAMPELAVANQGSSTVSVFRNTGSSGSITTGSFATHVTFGTGSSPYSVAIGDIDGDGKPDLAVANASSSTVSVLRNASSSGSITTGSFATQVTFATGSSPRSVAIGDIDGDGKPDLAVADFIDYSVSVLRNSPLIPPPAITSISPAAGNAGTSVTVTGTNFNTTPSNNTVFFGATQATVTAASTTSLTATVPVGATYKNVSVNNTALSLAGYSQYPFLPTYDNSAYMPGSFNFAGKADFAVGISAFSVAIGDIDGDGKPDLAVANINANTVSVYRNTSSSGSITSGSFTTHETFATGSNPYSVAIGDIDGDGKPDLAVANYGSNTVSVYRNTSSSGSIPTISFDEEVTFAAGSQPTSVAIGDIDGDGMPDLATANLNSNTISVFRNTSSSGSITSGSFATQVTFATGSNPRSVAIGDIDGDGKPDLAVANLGSNTVSVYRNTSSSGSITTGSFATQVTFATGSSPYSVVIGDIDGDGKPDLAVANQGSNTVSVFRNTGSSGSITTGSFATQVTFATGTQPYNVAIGDIDGDGKPDLAVANNSSGTVSVLRNTSSGSITTGSFATQVTFATGSNPQGVAVGDIDGDGKPDLAVANYSSNSISVLRNNPLSPIAGTINICTGSNSTLSNLATGGSWSSSTTGAATIGTAGIVTGIAAGTTTISYTVTGGSATVVVTVAPIADAGVITGTAAICPGDTLVLSDTVSGGVWSSSNTAVATVNTSGTVTGISGGTATISYIVTGSCGSGTATTVVTINALPNAGVITGTAAICPGDILVLSDTVSGGVWSSSNTAIATVNTSGTVTGISGGTATISYIITGSCGSSQAVAIVTINAVPNGGTITGPSSVNTGAAITLANAAGGGTWSSSNTAVATVGSTGIVTGVSGGNAVISYTVTNSCGSASAIKNITVNVTSPGGETDVICAGATTTLSSAGGGTWSSNNTSIATIGITTGIVSGIAPGVVTMTYTTTTGSTTTPITVNATPSMITGTMSACAGAATVLNTTTTGGAWSSAATAIATISAGGVVTGISAGTAIISYTNSNGCAKTTTVTINALPATISGSLALCIGASTTLGNTTTGGSWSSAASSVISGPSATGIITGEAAGTATISYSLSTGCKTMSVVTVTAVPAAITGAGSVCAGSMVTLANITAGGLWSSSTLTVATIDDATGIVTGVAAGTSVVSYSIGTGCYVTKNITVNISPAAIGGTLSVCMGATTALSNATTPGLSWTSGNTAIATVNSTTGLASGVAAGNAIITYSLATGCKTTAVVTVDPLPNAITGAMAVCIGGNTTLTSTTGGTWLSSNAAVATIGTAGDVTGIAAGTARMTYTAASGCTRTATVTVNALPPAITGAGIACAGNTTTLAGGGSGIWSSSDAGVASVITTGAGYIQGVSAGTATITFAFGTGCYSTKVVTITATPAAITGMGAVCKGMTTTLGNSVSGGSWSSSNPAIATIGTAGIVTGVNGGNAAISYTIGSCRVTTNVTVNNSAPIGGVLSICAGGATALGNPVTGGTWASSTPAIATVGTTGIVSGISSGTTDITYTTAAGCTSAAIVTVGAAPAAITGPSTVCIGTAITLSNAGGGGSWSSSNASVATIGTATGIVTGMVTGTTTITNATGTACRTTTVVTVAGVNAITGTASVCAGATTTLYDATTGGAWSSSNVAIATVGGTGVVTGISAGNASITYTAPNTCIAIRAVTVNPGAASITGNTPVCVGSSVTLGSTGGTWSAPTTSVMSGPSSTGIITGLAAGTAIVSYTLSTGCRATTIITVNPLPANISLTGTSNLKVCIAASLPLTDATPGGTWSTSNAALATVGTATGVVAGVSAGTVSISYTLATGCYKSVNVTVNANPAAITGTFSVCATMTTTLSNATTGGASWASGNTAKATVNATNGIVSGVSAGTANITYSLATGCYATQAVTVEACSRPGGSSIDQPAFNSMQLYPNPTTGAFNVVSEGAGTIYLYTMDGKELAKYIVTAGINSFSLPPGIAAGVYMCRYAGNDGATMIVRLVYEQ